MSASHGRAKEIVDYSDKHGDEKTCEQYGINNESVARYKRLAARPYVLAPAGDGKGPKVLIFDIETTPMLSWHWRCYKENINPVQIVKHSHVLCWVAKWLGSDAIYFDSVKGDGEDDKRCCEELWTLCDEADIVVAHNGQAFDMGTMNARWAYHGLNPPSPAKMADTLKIARGVFNFPTNKLEGITRYFGIGSKKEHEGFRLWLKCMDGDPKAWKTMEEYNIEDVLILEELYLRIRPWDKRHANVSLLYDDEKMRCVCCGSTDIKRMKKNARTNVTVFPAYRCMSCGKPMRGRGRFAISENTLANII